LAIALSGRMILEDFRARFHRERFSGFEAARGEASLPIRGRGNALPTPLLLNHPLQHSQLFLRGKTLLLDRAGLVASLAIFVAAAKRFQQLLQASRCIERSLRVSLLVQLN
jgi:hypothetical protein